MTEPGPVAAQPPHLRVPEGFSVELFTDQVPNARSIAKGPPGVLFVSTRDDDKVYAVVDQDGDHRVDRVQVVAEGLSTPNGIAYRAGSLYVAEIGRLLRIDGLADELERATAPVEVRSDFPEDKHHGWRYLRFGPDGLLYMGVGAPCNVCERRERVYASIVRIPPDGGPLEIFAQGVRNTVGFDFHPDTKQLWFTDNGRDLLGDDVPPDELNRAAQLGQHFGFPFCHGGDLADPDFGATRPCRAFTPPVHRFGAHVAALGMRFYRGGMFPDRYKNAVIVAQHGSWNRAQKSGYRVMALRTEGDEVTSAEPLLTGFLAEDGETVRGRPVDVEVLDDGSLVVSDDFAGALYRITYRD